MKTCSICKSKMKVCHGKTPEGITYEYFKCTHCGEEIVDMQQLHNVADKYRKIKQYRARLSKWGLSLGVRIPKELVKRYKLHTKKEVSIIPEEKGIMIVPTEQE